MSGTSGRPSLGAVLSGRQGVAGQAAQTVMQRAADVLETVKNNQELKGATEVIRAATGGGGEMHMDPVKTAVEALRAGADLASDRETKQAQAAAALATAEVERTKVKQEGELGIIGAVTALADRFGGGSKGSDLDTFVRLLELTRPQQPQGINLDGLAAIITALVPVLQPMLQRPQGGSSDAALVEVHHQLELLGTRLESKGSGGGMDLGGLMTALKQVQEITGTSPSHSLETRKLDVEEKIALHEISEREASRRAEYENTGQLAGVVGDVVRAYATGEARRDGPPQNAPVPDAHPSQAVQRVAIRCGNCQKLIPIQGTPPASMNCPHCGSAIGRGAA